MRGPRRFRSRSVGLVERSTQRPDGVVAPDWRSLRVVLNYRGAIFAEDFPAAITAAGAEMVELFTHDEAQGLLFTFAGAWPVLGQDAGDSSTRFVSVDGPACLPLSRGRAGARRNRDRRRRDSLTPTASLMCSASRTRLPARSQSSPCAVAIHPRRHRPVTVAGRRSDDVRITAGRDLVA